jgi:FkbM family methyltransferase
MFNIYKILQKLPQFKGKLRLAKLLIWKKNISKTFSVPNGLIFTVPNLIENISFELLINGSYEEKYLNLIDNSIPRNGIFIDIGANIGAISVMLAKQRPDITIHAFEASPNVFQFLKLNKEKNKLTNLNIYNLAIHSTDNLELPFYSPKTLNGKGSFSPVFTQDSEIVKTISMDSFFNINNIYPNFIKVDVEGYEALIFDSMKKYLSSNDTCNILFEFVDWAEKLANYEIGTSQKIMLDNKFLLYDLESNTNINKPQLTGYTMILAEKFKEVTNQ